MYAYSAAEYMALSGGKETFLVYLSVSDSMVL